MTTNDVTKIAILVEIGGKVYQAPIAKTYYSYLLQTVAALQESGELKLVPAEEHLKFED